MKIKDKLQELALLAEVSQEPKFLEALRDNKDLHSYCASLIFDIPYKDFFIYDENGNEVLDKDGNPEIKPDMKKKYRNPCKSLSFGLIYGMGVKKLAKELGITLEEAKELREKYFEEFPKIRELMTRLGENIKKRKYALSPLDGRRRDLSSIDWDHPGRVASAMNQAKNLPFQGCGASTTKLALCRLKSRIDEEGWDARICIVVHDELVVEVHEDIAEEVAKGVEEEMIKAFNYFASSVPMKVSAEIGPHWIH